MGKSSKKKKATDLVASVYARATDMTKEDMLYLKHHLNQSGAQIRIRHKSNAAKKQTDYLPMMGSVKHNQVFFFNSMAEQPQPEVSFMARQQDVVLSANQYIQRQILASRGKNSSKRRN